VASVYAITLEKTMNYRIIPKILHSYSQVIHMEEMALENAAPPIVPNKNILINEKVMLYQRNNAPSASFG
jgi:hypothetical protein